jgi:peptide/nickel transport system permease protein
MALAVLIIVTAIVFVLMHLLPGDPILYYLSQEQTVKATPEQLAQLRHEFGIDRPIYIQYISWVKDLLRGDLGDSINWNFSVNKLLKQTMPISLYIGAITWIISHAISIPVGIICAIRRGKWIDTVLTILANIGITAPGFWVGVLAIYVFSLWLGWLPTHGYTPPLQDFWMSIKQLIMPVFVLSIGSIAGGVRLTRSCMLEVLNQDYMRTAYSKGLRERVVIFRHALKNGMLPVVTVMGMSIATIIGGQVLIEQVFAIPGMGRLAVDALFAREYAVVQGLVLIIATVVLLSNLLVDISYGWLDPRVRYD